MKNLFDSIRPMSLFIGLTLAAMPIRAEVGLSIEAPVVLPRNTHLGAYSPAWRIKYSSVPKGRHRLKLWLLETSTGNYYCASTQLCEREFEVDNTSGTNSTGVISSAENFDVFDYSGFLWVARLYDQHGGELASARREAESATQRPPMLHRIGRKTCVPSEELRFKVTATAGNGETVRFGGRHLPSGAALDPETGEFKWRPAQSRKVSGVVIEALIPDTGLTDAEIIEIEVRAGK